MLILLVTRLPSGFGYWSFLLETVTSGSGKYNSNSYQTVLDLELAFWN